MEQIRSILKFQAFTGKLKFIICASLSFLVRLIGEAQQNREHPTVVFILVDDLGWADLGYQGSKSCELPNVDGLASEGMSFFQFYSGGSLSSPLQERQL